jgi:hypothetical protein
MTPTNAERRRARNLRPALAFLRLPSTEPELNILHRVFDNLGLITVGVECQGDAPLALAYRRRGMAGDVPGQPDMGAQGFGVAPTPWKVGQNGAWMAVKRGYPLREPT